MSYAELRAQLGALLDGVDDPVARMATTAALLHDSLDHVFWVGFYLPRADGSLVVGPYQGPLASVVLPPGRGVCGAAAKSRETVIVPDVHAFEGHISCSPRSRSEIVVPVMRGDELIAVLDLDSDTPAAFDEDDARGLEDVVRLLSAA